MSSFLSSDTQLESDKLDKIIWLSENLTKQLTLREPSYFQSVLGKVTRGWKL